jgi:hypothetical protein
MRTENDDTQQPGSVKRRYQWMSVGVVIVFIYILGTEVWDRASALVQLSSEVGSRAGLAVAPESLQAREHFLIGERNRLVRLWNQSGTNDPVPGSESAFYAYIERLAAEQSVEILSVEPLEGPKTSTHVKEVRFKVQGKAEYHHLGRFLWRLESGGRATVRIETVSIKRRDTLEKGHEGLLDIVFEGRATIVTAL